MLRQAVVEPGWAVVALALADAAPSQAGLSSPSLMLRQAGLSLATPQLTAAPLTAAQQFNLEIGGSKRESQESASISASPARPSPPYLRSN